MSHKIDTQSMLEVGTLLRKIYRIDAHLGSGGFGKTYLATNVEFDEQVAIKEFFMKDICYRKKDHVTVAVNSSSNQGQFEKQLDVFKREARRVRRMNNAHIVQVHDLFEENGTAYFVMDYINGKSLGDQLEEFQQPFDSTWLMQSILPQMLDALEIVHHQQIWHLDIKPDNIMLDANGNATLIDFGASKQIDTNSSDPATVASVMLLTLPYAPSELRDGDYSRIGPWTDIYSLGATLYKLATNQKPPQPTAIDVEGPSAFKFLPGTNEAFQRLVQWMMRTRTDRRPQDVNEVKNALSSGIIPEVVTEPVDEEDEETKIQRKPDVTTHKEKPDDSYRENTPPYTLPDDSDNQPKSKKTTAVVIGTFVATLLVSSLIMSLFWDRITGKTSPNPNDTEAVADTVVKDFVYTTNINGNATTFKYTGPLVNNVPNGEGKGVYDNNGIYEGTYVDGHREGENCKFTWTVGENKGDVYVGGFKNDLLDGECTFTQGDGFYFKGIAKSGNWHQGDWYDKNGNHVSCVVDGTEIEDSQIAPTE